MVSGNRTVPRKHGRAEKADAKFNILKNLERPLQKSALSRVLGMIIYT